MEPTCILKFFQRHLSMVFATSCKVSCTARRKAVPRRPVKERVFATWPLPRMLARQHQEYMLGDSQPQNHFPLGRGQNHTGSIVYSIKKKLLVGATKSPTCLKVECFCWRQVHLGFSFNAGRLYAFPKYGSDIKGARNRGNGGVV